MKFEDHFSRTSHYGSLFTYIVRTKNTFVTLTNDVKTSFSCVIAWARTSK